MFDLIRGSEEMISGDSTYYKISGISGAILYPGGHV